MIWMVKEIAGISPSLSLRIMDSDWNQSPVFRNSGDQTAEVAEGQTTGSSATGGSTFFTGKPRLTMAAIGMLKSNF